MPDWGWIVGNTEVVGTPRPEISTGKSASLQRLIARCWRVYREQSANPEALLSVSPSLGSKREA